jgi:hypothetical protein
VAGRAAPCFISHHAALGGSECTCFDRVAAVSTMLPHLGTGSSATEHVITATAPASLDNKRGTWPVAGGDLRWNGWTCGVVPGRGSTPTDAYLCTAAILHAPSRALLSATRMTELRGFDTALRCAELGSFDKALVVPDHDGKTAGHLPEGCARQA